MAFIKYHLVDRKKSAQTTDRGYVPNVERDNQGRIHFAYGQLDINKSIGTDSQEKIRKLLRPFYIEGDEACHIIPKEWGGSGFHADNFYVGCANMNRGMDKEMEKTLAFYARVEFSIEFFYIGSCKRPDRLNFIRTLYKKENGNYIEGPTETGTDENFANKLSKSVKPKDL